MSSNARDTRSLGRRSATPKPAATEVRISNGATYWPVSPLDVVVGTPVVARLLLGASPLGRVVQAVALGAYVASAVRDWRDRRSIRRIDFRREFGADLGHLRVMPHDARAAEVRALAQRLNDEFDARRVCRRELAVLVDRELTGYIAEITGQHVRSSTEVRGFMLARLAFPFAVGACDILSGDVAIFQETGIFEPHILAHEFTHRKGYWKELHAQVLAYLSLASSGDPLLRQAARVERAYRQLRVLCDGRIEHFQQLVEGGEFRREVRDALLQPRGASGAVGRHVNTAMRRVYDTRMRLTRQNGISDYDLGFTNFLYTFETSTAALRTPPSL